MFEMDAISAALELPVVDDDDASVDGYFNNLVPAGMRKTLRKTSGYSIKFVQPPGPDKSENSMNAVQQAGLVFTSNKGRFGQWWLTENFEKLGGVWNIDQITIIPHPARAWTAAIQLNGKLVDSPPQLVAAQKYNMEESSMRFTGIPTVLKLDKSPPTLFQATPIVYDPVKSKGKARADAFALKYASLGGNGDAPWKSVPQGDAHPRTINRKEGDNHYGPSK